MFFLSFPGEIKALNDFWIIGDDFVMQNYHHFQDIRRAAQVDRQPIPYIYEYYVLCFTTAPDALVTDILTQFVNALVFALNDTLKLPCIILVIPGKDIIKYVDFDESGTRFMHGGALAWIITQMVRFIDAKKDNLLHRKAGAVVVHKPKIIWVKTLRKLDTPLASLAVINKFNGMLEDILVDRESHFIMDVDAALHDPAFFNIYNEMNNHGKLQFWLEVDSHIEKFEKKALSLKPMHRIRIADPDDFNDK